MPYKVTVIEEPAFQRMLHSDTGNVARLVLARALRVETAAKRRVKVDHGRLRQSITHQFIRTAEGYPGARVGTNVSYAQDVHGGTGIYGPHQTPILPKRGTRLKFTGRDGKIVFAPSVKGQRPNPFLRDALNEV